MEATYHCHINELSDGFIKAIRKQFANAYVDIIVKDIDETSYLTASETNKEILMLAVQQVKDAQLISHSVKELGL